MYVLVLTVQSDLSRPNRSEIKAGRHLLSLSFTCLRRISVRRDTVFDG
jgi:hypothetical protein